jgi:predicted RecB family nuclease
MQISDGAPFYSPSDLITFMESTFASHMERSRLNDSSISDLMGPDDPMLKTLQKKGYEHEDAFLKSLKSENKNIVEIERASTELMQSRTRAAMESGAEIIAQAYLQLDNFGGLADFLIKVDGNSRLGSYHYEVWDTKLSKKMKPYFAIQLCCYSGL